MTTVTPPAPPSAPWLHRFEIPGRRTWFTRGALARMLMARIVADLDVALVHPDGTVLGRADSANRIIVHRPAALYRRLEAHPKLGFGEGYLAGDWVVAPGSDLAAVMAPFAARLDRLLPPWLMSLRKLVDRAIPAHQRNTLAGSRANIEAHYDLSNDLFMAFLDPTMTYSSALFEADKPRSEQSLQLAQERKLDAILDAAGATREAIAEAGEQGFRLLEIGTGWGSMAIRAAARGAQVTTITLSKEQAVEARDRIAAAGYATRVEVRVQDYREVCGQFDAIVSVEMIEAVGAEFWPDYCRSLDRALKPGGRAVLQAILMSHERLEATKHSYGWINKYIFPGGLIPSQQALAEAAARHTTLRLTQSRHFGLDYAHTLRRWRAQFLEHWPHINRLGFDETFRRMWEFYLAYCEAGFSAEYLDVAHLTFTRPQEN